MNKIGERVSFEEIRLKNYGIFYGDFTFSFSDTRTVFYGLPGCGRTTIFEAMKNLGPVDGVTVSAQSKSREILVEVKIRGNSDLISKFKEIIFFDYETWRMHLKNDFSGFFSGFSDNDVLSLTKKIFSILLKRKPHKIKVHSDLDPRVMAMEECFCLYLAQIFALREISNISLPFVADRPFGFLGEDLRSTVREFFNQYGGQQIFFHGISEMSEEFLECDKVYRLGQEYCP